MNKIVHVLITGKVQGVWFRATTKQEAEKRGINGWVRNTTEGKVEAVFQGSENQVADMIKWCYEGSRFSHVDHVETTDVKQDKQYTNFTIRY